MADSVTSTWGGKGKGRDVEQSSSSEDIYIIILGPLGSGKTSFIDLCCGSNRRQLGTTQSITEAVFEYDSRKVHLIDTPGFDQSGVRSSLILCQVAFFLAAAYKIKIAINGFLYIQDVTQGTLEDYRSTLTMLSKVVGVGKSHIVFAKSKWNILKGQDGNAAQFESLPHYQKPFVGESGQTFILDELSSSALPVVSWFASQQLPGPLQIQREFAGKPISLDHTEFGREMSLLWMSNQPMLREQLHHFLYDGNEFCLDPLHAGNHSEDFAGTKRRIGKMRWYLFKMVDVVVSRGAFFGTRSTILLAEQQADVIGLWEDWILQSLILQSLDGSVNKLSARPKKYHADSVGSSMSYEKSTIEEADHTLKADDAKSADLSSDTSSDGNDEGTGLKSRLARNQNQLSAQTFPLPRHAKESFSSEGRMTGSNPRTNHTERMNVRAELYQHSLLGLKGHAGPSLSAEDIDRIGMAVMVTDLEDLEVRGIATSFEFRFLKPLLKPLPVSQRSSSNKQLAWYAWLCEEVFICGNMAILVYSNFKRLQNANLAGGYISIVVSQKDYRTPPIPMMVPKVANLNRLHFKWVLELVLVFGACIHALRKQITYTPSDISRLELPWDKLMEIDRVCRKFLERTELNWKNQTENFLRFLRDDTSGLLGHGTHHLSRVIALWRCALGVVDLAILAYEGAHATSFDQKILGDNCGTIELHNQKSSLFQASSPAKLEGSFQLRRQKMGCLAGLFEDKDVWVFGWFSSQDLRSSWYLSADIVTFADVWGPVWKVIDTTREKRVARYNVGGGSIVPWPYDSAIHPYLEPHERLCHWRSNAASVRFKKAGSSNTSPSSSLSDADEGEEAGSDLESFGDETRLMIGADPTPRMQWKKCHCRIDDLVQHLKDAGRLDHIIASKSYRHVDSQQTSLVIGSHGVQAGRTNTIKDKREENLKTSLLDRWENEPHSRDPREFENLWGVLVSLCTMNARRVRLVELLGDDSVVALLRQFPWSDSSSDGSTSQLRDQYLEAVYSADPRALGDLWDMHPSWREELGKAILICLKILVLTGFNDNREEFYMLWLPPGCRGPRRITLKSTDQTWVKFLKDTTYSVTMAVAVEDSLTSKSHRRKCKHIRPRWFQHPSLLETAICINNALEPTPKLVRVPGSQDGNQDSWRLDLREWRSIWDISALDIGEQFWVGSQTRVRVVAAPTKWHLLLEIDTVKRLILREIFGMKASEKTGHWEYTDAEAETIEVRPIPVHITSQNGSYGPLPTINARWKSMHRLSILLSEEPNH